MSRFALTLFVNGAVAAGAAQAAAQPAPAAPPAPAGAPAPAPTIEYTVVAGDSCLSIARRFVGTPRALDELHQLNPQLGATPHNLVPGQKLQLPQRKPPDPDANLTAARGDVAVRRPAETSWDAARRGMDLFRAWRVGARERASAEVTFRDSSQLRLRENTVVIIYGPAAPRQPASALRAEIEGGSLEARLAAASGSPPSVLTPSAMATLGRGSSLVSVDSAGTSLFANHAGDPVVVHAVTKRIARGAPVRVQSGMGSRVEKGKLPEPPRPLPAPPRFAQPSLIVPTFGASAAVSVTWQPVAGAIRYRAVVLDAQGVEQNAVLVPPGLSSLELDGIPAGSARIQISAIDAAGFEGAPAALEVQVVAVTATPPGSSAPVASDGGKLALGSRLASTGGLACTLTPVDAAGQPVAASDDVARRVGPHQARCGDPSSSAVTTVEVVGWSASIAGPAAAIPRDRAVPVAIAVQGPVPPGPGLVATASAGLTIESQAWIGETLTVMVRATEAAGDDERLRLLSAGGADASALELASIPLTIAAAARLELRSAAPARWAIDLGGVAGLVLPPDGAEFGDATAPRDRFSSGALLGARAAVASRQRPYLAARLELAASSLSQVGTSRSATLLLPSAALALRPVQLAPLELWTFAGVGAAALLSAPGTSRAQTALALHAGGGALVRKSGLALELSAQWSLLAPSGVAEAWPSIRLGISSSFAR